MEKEKERKGERGEKREEEKVRYYLCHVGTCSMCTYAALTLGVEWCLLNCDSEYERI